MSQGPKTSFAQRAKEDAERLERLAERFSDKPAATEAASEVPTAPVAPASVPDVAGKDVAVPTTLVPPAAPVAAPEPAPAPESDVSLLRDQLSEVVTNFRGRLNSHDAVLASVESAAKAVADRVTAVEGFVEDHKAALETLLAAIEAITK